MTYNADQTNSGVGKSNIISSEIELIDIILIIWKWKYLILAGTVVFILMALVFSYKMNVHKKYQISLVLKPGIIKEDYDGKPIYIDSVGNIKALIEGDLRYKIAEYAKFKISADKDTNNLFILYNASDPEEGTKNTILLLEMLNEEYNKKLKYWRENYQNKINIAKMQLKLINDDEQYIKMKLEEIQPTLDNYMQDINASNDNSKHQSFSSELLLDYSSIIAKITDIQQKRSQAVLKIGNYKNDIRKLEYELENLKGIQVVRGINSSKQPVGAHIFIIAVTAVIGTFVMILFSFLLEYVFENYKKKASV